MSTIQIRKADLTTQDTQAIVNTTNNSLRADGGISASIFSAAGPDLLKEACEKLGHCDTGAAVITPGFHLKAKYIIHTVGPHYYDGQHKEAPLLYGAYRSCLELAASYGITSISFPTISTGLHGYPHEQAWVIAITACKDFLSKGNEMDIMFCVQGNQHLETGEEILKQLALKFVLARKSDWKAIPMPSLQETFSIDRVFTPGQMKALKKGSIPQRTEDLWFYYMEDNTLYAHQSWTGFCIYQIDFSPEGRLLKVTVNHYPEQYAFQGLPKEKETLSLLLDAWSGAPDHRESGKLYKKDESQTGRDSSLPAAFRGKETLHVSGMEAEAIFFHLPGEPYGFLSNLSPSPFDLEGIHFSSAEQYNLYQKCMLFGDSYGARSVLDTEDPILQMKLGKSPKGYIGVVWVGMRQLIAQRGLLAKFSQNEDLRQKLLNTGNAWLVYCSPKDPIWGCGYRLNEEGRLQASGWKGQNLLGFVLMEVRSFLRT